VKIKNLIAPLSLIIIWEGRVGVDDLEIKEMMKRNKKILASLKLLNYQNKIRDMNRIKNWKTTVDFYLKKINKVVYLYLQL
jgi:hypothetical protein